MKRYVGKKSGTIRSLTGWKMRRQPDLPIKARNAYLAALVDVIDGISFEIYEKYRTLTAV